MIEFLCWLFGLEYEIIESIFDWFWLAVFISVIVVAMFTGKVWLVDDKKKNGTKAK